MRPTHDNNTLGELGSLLVVPLPCLGDLLSSTLPSGTVSRTTIILTTQGAAAAVVTREFVVPGERNGNDDDTEGTRKNKRNTYREYIDSNQQANSNEAISIPKNVVVVAQELDDNTANNSGNPTRSTTTNTRKNFRYNPQRRWDLEYFRDPTGSRPQPNTDTLLRRQHALI